MQNMSPCICIGPFVKGVKAETPIGSNLKKTLFCLELEGVLELEQEGLCLSESLFSLNPHVSDNVYRPLRFSHA